MAEDNGNRRLSTGNLGSDSDGQVSALAREDAAFSSVHTGTTDRRDPRFQRETVEEGGGDVGPLPLAPVSDTEARGPVGASVQDRLPTSPAPRSDRGPDGEPAGIPSDPRSSTALSSADWALPVPTSDAVDPVAGDPAAPAVRPLQTIFPAEPAIAPAAAQEDTPQTGSGASDGADPGTPDAPGTPGDVSPGAPGDPDPENPAGPDIDPPQDSADPPADAPAIPAPAPGTDAPLLALADAQGREDAPVPLAISLAPGDPSETVAVTVAGLPEGARLSAGTANPDGSWSLDPADLPGLELTPPADFSGRIDLQVTATARDGADTASTGGPLAVDIAPVADAPLLALADAQGREDAPVPLAISLAPGDPSETVAVTVAGLPEGARLSAGTANPDGSWSLDPADLPGLELTPPADFSGRIDLQVTATARDGADTASTGGPLAVDIAPVADAPLLALADAQGREDAPVPLAISLAPGDPSETVAVTVAGLPEGARLSAGTANPDGSWSLDPADLPGLELTPPADFSGRIDLQVTATARDGADTASTGGPLAVDIAPVADAPLLALADAQGREDAPVPLAISLAPGDPSETVAVTVAGLPEGARLSAGTANPDGSWSLDPADLPGLELTPPADFSGRIDLQVTATARDGADTASTGGPLAVDIAPVADAPLLALADAQGREDAPVPLAISLAPGDPSETVAVTVAGLPEGARLSAGTANPDGSWSLDPADLPGLELTPPADFSGRIDLQVTATARDGADTASTGGPLAVDIAPVADAPLLALADAQGREDAPVPLAISLAPGDPSETVAVTVAGLPEGARLSAGTANPDGSWSLDPADLPGLELTPPADFSGRIDLQVTATARDGADTASTGGPLAVDIAPVADAPLLALADAQGREDAPVPLALGAAVTDLSESLSVTVAGLPEGARLSAGTANPDGSWSLDPADLPGIRLLPPRDFSGSIDLAITATSRDGADTASRSATMTVELAPVADAPHLSVQVARLPSEEATPSSAAGAAMAASPAGAATIVPGLSRNENIKTGSGDDLLIVDGDLAGGNNIHMEGGDDILEIRGAIGKNVHAHGGDGADMLRLAKAAEAYEVGNLVENQGRIHAQITDTDSGGRLLVNHFESIVFGDGTVIGDAGLLRPSPPDAVYALRIEAEPGDVDGSETLGLTLSGLPEGARPSAGEATGTGTWQLDPADLAGLDLTVPAEAQQDFTLRVTATSTERAAPGGGATKHVDLQVGAGTPVLEEAPRLSLADLAAAQSHPEAEAPPVEGAPEAAAALALQDIANLFVAALDLPAPVTADPVYHDVGPVMLDLHTDLPAMPAGHDAAV